MRWAMRIVLLLLAIAGVVVSAKALHVHNSTDTPPCSINEHWDCGVVNRSEYAEIHHFPVATIGILGYALLGLLALSGRRLWFFLACLPALGFALHLTWIERNILQVWCLYCVISQGIILLMTLLGVSWWLWGRGQRRTSPA
jgi:vitamin-K-epoxide reductase (warfarin-sensitive)